MPLRTFQVRQQSLLTSARMWVVATLTLLVSAPTTPSFAGVSTAITATEGNGNLGTSIAQNGTVYTITGGTRPGGGANLLHSFGNFTIGSGDIASFVNTTGLPTANILSRVTGGTPSSIFGTIHTSGFGEANFFLINPAGIVFGPQASLQVGGSVHFTTASDIRLFDGFASTHFYANPASDQLANSLLALPPLSHFGFMTASPAGYGFMDGQAASIAIQGGSLAVPDGHTLSIVGGPTPVPLPDGQATRPGVVMTGGSLSAPNGLVYLATATAPGDMPLPTPSGVPLATPDTHAVTNTVIRIRGGELILDHASVGASHATDSASPPIDIMAQGAMTMRNGSVLSSETSSPGRGSDIHISAHSLVLDGSTITSTTLGDGAGGHIVLNSTTLHLAHGAQISSHTNGGGTGGAISIAVSDSVSLAGFDTTGTGTGIPDTDTGIVRTGLYSSTSSSGTGGSLTLSTPSLTMEDGALLTTVTTGSGAGGRLAVIEAERVSLTSGAQLTSRATGSGQGGDIAVTATDSISMAGFSLDTFSVSGIFSLTTGPGKGARLQMDAPRVTLSEMGQIRSQTISAEDNAGNGGHIAIAATDTLSVIGFSDDFGIGSGIFSSGEHGASGSITLSGPTIMVADRAEIASSQNLAHHSGGITVDAGTMTLTGGAAIHTVSGSTGAPSTGAITLSASDTLRVSGLFDATTPSRISNESLSVAGSNGGIMLDARHVIFSDGAQLFSNTAASQGGTMAVSGHESITMTAGAQAINVRGSLDHGSIHMTAPSLLFDQATIRSRTNGDHDAGAITLTATHGSLTLSNESHLLTMTQGGRGHGGPIEVSASEEVRLSDGATLESGTTNIAEGNGGPIMVTAGTRITLTDPGTGLFSLTDTAGHGGSLTVQAPYVLLSNGAILSAAATGTGPAGRVAIRAGTSVTAHDSLITTQSAKSGGGQIEISATDTIRLVHSTIRSSVLDGAGGGGDIFIDPHAVILQNSHILAQAVLGAGGNITIVTPVFLADHASMVSASSQFGLSGTVNIQSPTSNLAGTAAVLPSSFRQSPTLFTGRCAARADSQTSSLVLAGRERMPSAPDGWMASPPELPEQPAHETAHTAPTTTQDPEAAGYTVPLRRLYPAGFLTWHFAESGLTACRS